MRKGTTTTGVIKGDTRSLDYSSDDAHHIHRMPWHDVAL